MIPPWRLEAQSLGDTKMLNRRDALRSIALASAAIPSWSSVVLGQEPWKPAQPIHLICPFTAGSGADVVVRYYAKELQELVGQTVIVENKVGAAGRLASEYVARSKPDGLTVYLIPGTNVLASAPSLYKTLSFDPVTDFEHVTTVAKVPLVLVVSAKGPFKTVPDLVGYLKQQGDKGSFGAVSNTSLFTGELFKSKFDLTTLDVRFKDFPSAMNELLSGSISFVYLDPGQAMGHVAAGRISALATTTVERSSAMPDVPGSKEAGIPNMDIMFWWSAHVAKGTPKPIVSQLEKWFNTITTSAETKAFLEARGNTPFPGTSEGLRALLVAEIENWKEYARIAKIEKQ
jgi:tripartite-type tricarboxylate transporter receptor subunit TctC